MDDADLTAKIPTEKYDFIIRKLKLASMGDTQNSTAREMNVEELRENGMMMMNREEREGKMVMGGEGGRRV